MFIEGAVSSSARTEAERIRNDSPTGYEDVRAWIYEPGKNAWSPRGLRNIFAQVDFGVSGNTTTGSDPTAPASYWSN